MPTNRVWCRGMANLKIGGTFVFCLAAGYAMCLPQQSGGNTTTGTFDSKGCTIRYAIAGSGEPVILLHGWMGEARNWGPGTREKPVLSAPPGFQIIAPDLRGHGLSGKPHEAGKYGANMASDVLRLMDHLKIKKAHLVGYSMGAYVAGKVVEMAPGRIASVVYGGSSPVLDTRKVKTFGDAESFARAVDAGKGLGQYLLDVAPMGQFKPSLEQANIMAEKLYAGEDVKALAACGRSFAKLQVRASAMSRSKVPTLFITGSKESQYVMDRVSEAKLVMPHARFEAIEGTNHLTTMSSPRFGALIVAFIRANPIAR